MGAAEALVSGVCAGGRLVHCLQGASLQAPPLHAEGRPVPLLLAAACHRRVVQGAQPLR